MSDEAARRPEDNGAGAIWKKQGRVWLGECPRSAEADVAGLPLEKKEASRLLGLQPFLQTSDYRSKETFVEAISRPLEAARLEGWLEGPSIGVYPEHLGTWLCAIDEGKGVWGAKTIERAMRALVWRHPWALVRALGRAHGKDRLKDAVFRMSAEAMARHYEAIFSSLAKTYKLWLVAGSILLPGPEVRQKRLQIDPKAPLVNASAVFDPQGQIQEALVYKSFLVEEEQAFLQARSIKEGPTFQTEVGRLKVLICADSWYPQSYETAGAEETELWLIPAYLVGDGIWKRPWAGYNGHEAPSDVERSDVLKKTEGEAWWAYSMATRLLRWKKACGMQVFLRGSFWELGSDGYPIVCVEGKSYLLCPPQDGEDLVISLRLAQRRRSPLRGQAAPRPVLSYGYAQMEKEASVMRNSPFRLGLLFLSWLAFGVLGACIPPPPLPEDPKPLILADNGAICTPGKAAETCQGKGCIALALTGKSAAGICTERCEKAGEPCKAKGRCVGDVFQEGLFCLLPCQADSDCPPYLRCSARVSKEGTFCWQPPQESVGLKNGGLCKSDGDCLGKECFGGEKLQDGVMLCSERCSTLGEPCSFGGTCALTTTSKEIYCLLECTSNQDCQTPLTCTKTPGGRSYCGIKP